ncbi:MAG: hypothetical protein HY717_06530 [Planctomycetes bacterium]|nr:hypothetical protein [Planctomycetota bacterium]
MSAKIIDCLFENREGRALPLLWDGKDGREHAGQPVRLRFYRRDARIYSLGPVR